MLIDEFIPHYQFVERHAITIPRPRDEVYRVLRKVDFGRSRVIRTLFALRGLGPSFRRGRSRMRLRLDDFVRAGFTLLAEQPGEEAVYGVASRGTGRRRRIRPLDPKSFASLDQPGCIKAVLNFCLRSLNGSSTLVTTETRVFATDEPARRAFTRYWMVVGPFSALIRRRMLAVLRTECLAD